MYRIRKVKDNVYKIEYYSNNKLVKSTVNKLIKTQGETMVFKNSKGNLVYVGGEKCLKLEIK